MKYAITEKTNIENIPRDTAEIHLVRPIKWEKLHLLTTRCPIKTITLSTSCLKRLPHKTQKRLKEKGITMGIEKRRGRAIDIPMEKMLQIIELRKDYQTVREIEKITGVPKSTVHYLIKYADRGKIKKGNNVVYLK
ncbi:MAG: hypothetical protein NTY48_01355 [Candidatus Diapherotrites archaeon]|nr:hypothetical protein [Candidatus Diapherotrites archaeon]